MKFFIILSLFWFSNYFGETTNIQKKSEISSLAPIISLMSKLFDKLHASNTKLQEKVRENEKKMIRLEHRIRSVEEKADKNRKMAGKNGRKTDKIKTRVQQMTSDVTNLQKGVRNLKMKAKGPVFSAMLKTALIKLAPYQILKFDHVLLNRNNAYDIRTGYFTVPWSGLYHISAVLRTFGGTDLHVYLWKDEQRLAMAFSGNWKTGSLQMMLVLKKGERVYLKKGEYKNEQIQGGPASIFSVAYLSE